MRSSGRSGLISSALGFHVGTGSLVISAAGFSGFISFRSTSVQELLVVLPIFWLEFGTWIATGGLAVLGVVICQAGICIGRDTLAAFFFLSSEVRLGRAIPVFVLVARGDTMVFVLGGFLHRISMILPRRASRSWSNRFRSLSSFTGSSSL